MVWIEQVLSNDEDSSDEEMLAYFVTNGLTLNQATSAWHTAMIIGATPTSLDRDTAV